ncbi:helix-turn-helix transcriptional regulator [Microbulbifer aggregans]|uniref:helix-turn-helix transcriptional regulator n=1 Tax=Microbulbifer aggregans TaxID=1769779 RepID=UPI001CFD7E92|nr:helix-turn-helix transcriptional regulator [Microbulbifer aggregans]
MNYDFFTGASCSLLLLAAARIGISRYRHSGSTWLLVVICGALFYLLRPLFGSSHPLLDLLLALPVIVVPAAFWLFAHALCSDSQDFPRWGWWLIATDFAIDLASHLNLHPAFYVIAQPFKLALIGAGLNTLLQQLHSDLVAERRQLRVALLIAIGGYMLIVVFAEFAFSYHQVPRGVPTLHVVLVSILTFASSLWLLALSPRALEESLPPAIEPVAESLATQAEPATLDQPQRQLLEKLQTHMSSGGYRHTGLTIRSLAEQLDAREHVLRVLINRHLGYRNFNEYLNQFRIDEASRRLADPDEAHLPVLTIALDIGYRSLSPFNAAFKRRHECTPTEYRREKLPA